MVFLHKDFHVFHLFGELYPLHTDLLSFRLLGRHGDQVTLGAVADKERPVSGVPALPGLWLPLSNSSAWIYAIARPLLPQA